MKYIWLFRHEQNGPEYCAFFIVSAIHGLSLLSFLTLSVLPASNMPRSSF